VLFVQIYIIVNSLGRSPKTTTNKFHETPTRAEELFHADTLTDGRTDSNDDANGKFD